MGGQLSVSRHDWSRTFLRKPVSLKFGVWKEKLFQISCNTEKTPPHVASQDAATLARLAFRTDDPTLDVRTQAPKLPHVPGEVGEGRCEQL